MPDDNLDPSGGKQGDGDSNSGDKGDKDGDSGQYITPERLQGVLSAHTKTQKKELQSSLDKLKNSLTEGLSEQIAETLKQLGGDKPDKKKDQVDPEVAKLRREFEKLESKNSDLESELAQTKTREKATRIKTRVMEALRKADCDNPEVVYSHIKDKIEEDEDGASIFVNVTNQYGTVEPVPAEEYIKTEVRERLVPQLFKGANRGGGPAEGDKGGSGRRYKYDWNVVKNQPQVLASEEFAKAHEAGEVSNLPTR